MDGSLEAQVAVNRDNIGDLQREVERLRDRIHTLSSTVRGVELVARRVAELDENLPHLARQAAREAVAEARRTRHADTLRNVSMYTGVALVGAALATIVIQLLLR